MSDVKSTMDGIYARKQEKVLKDKAREIEKKENGFINSLLVEYLPTGLYRCRYELGGPVPAEFEGNFTNRQRLVSLATSRWGNASKLKFA